MTSSKKLGISALVAIVIVAALYIFGMLYSRHLFFSHLDQALEDLEQEHGITLEKQDVSKGFFSSTFTLEGSLSMDNPDDLTLQAPLVAHHGIFSSSVDGSPVLRLQGEQLFSELLQADEEPRIDANFSTLSSRYHVHVDLPDSSLTDNGSTAHTHGLKVNIDGSAKNKHLDTAVEWQQLGLQDSTNSIVFGPGSLHVNVPDRTTLVGSNTHFELESATLRKALLGSLEVKDIHYADHYDKGDEGLDWHGEYHVGSVLRADQELGNSNVKLSISRLDEEALLALIRHKATASGTSEDTTDEGDDERAAAAQQVNDIKRLLSHSPLLTIEHFEVTSPLLGHPINATGQLGVDGNNIALSPQEADDGVFGVLAQQFYQHASGHINLTGLEGILGNKPGEDHTQIEFNDGNISINGEPLGGNPLDVNPLPSLP